MDWRGAAKVLSPVVTDQPRLVAIDIARGFALLGMVATHTFDEFDRDFTERSMIFEVAAGRSSALFAVLAGVSLALVSGRTQPLRGAPMHRSMVQVALRAALIAAIGFSIGSLESGLAVILVYYGLLFLLGIPFLMLSARWLFAAALVVTLAVPPISQLIRPDLPAGPIENPTWSSFSEPWLLFTDLTFTGFYPVIPWLSYLLLGMAIGRLDLTRVRNQLILIISGALVAGGLLWLMDRLLGKPDVQAALRPDLRVPDGFPDMAQAIRLEVESGQLGTHGTSTWWWQALASPHTASIADLAQTGASAAVVIGTLLLVFAGLGRLGVVGTELTWFASVLGGLGVMSLTLYTLHVGMRTGAPPIDDGVDAFMLHSGVIGIIGIWFAGARLRGPLEWGVRVVSRSVGLAVRVPEARDVQ